MSAIINNTERVTHKHNTRVQKQLEQSDALIQRLHDAEITIDALVADARVRQGLATADANGDDDLIAITDRRLSRIRKDMADLKQVRKSPGTLRSNYEIQRDLERDMVITLAWAYHQDWIFKGRALGPFSQYAYSAPEKSGPTFDEKLESFIDFVKLKFTIREAKFYFLGRNARMRVRSGMPYSGDYRLLLCVETHLAKTQWRRDLVETALRSLKGKLPIESIRAAMFVLINEHEDELIEIAKLSARIFTPEYSARNALKDDLAIFPIDNDDILVREMLLLKAAWTEQLGK